jgi:rubrerythrin
MGNILSGSEVVELGIQIEKNGRDFYNTLAQQATDPKAQEVFKFLSREEEKHIKVFEGILGKTQRFEPQGLDAEDYYSYLTTLAGEYIFTRKDKGIEPAHLIKNDLDAIEKAVGFEKESIIFYSGIKMIVHDYDQGIVETLIIQEEHHLRQLLDIKRMLQKG